jgi:peroxiredoxin
MAAVISTMQNLGSDAVGFELPDVRQNMRGTCLQNFAGQPLLIMFICNHCPFVIHMIAPLTALANRAQRDGAAVFAISSNDIQSYPQDAPHKMMEFASQHGFEFPYLYDESQQVAKLYGAACTPDFYVYDGQHRLVYRGQLDDSRPGNTKVVTGNDLSAGLTAAITAAAPPANQVPSIGCNIKWRVGNEPDYF